MNVYFISPQFLNPRDFSYLLRTLRISRVFSYIPQQELPEEIVASIPESVKITYNMDVKKQKEFLNRSVMSICHSIAPMKDSIRHDLDCGADSRADSPERNIGLKDDFNALILATCKTRTASNGRIFVPRHYFDETCPLYEEHKEIATETSKYCLNTLRKQLDTHKYQRRISFVKFDEFLTRSFYYTQGEWKEFTVKHDGEDMRFITYISRLLKQEFPQVYSTTSDEEDMYPTKEALVGYQNLKEDAALKRQVYYSRPDEEEEETPDCSGSSWCDSPFRNFLEVYGDALSDEEYDRYRDYYNDTDY